MDKHLIAPMDAIYLINDNYEKLGLKKGYVGVVVENLIKERGFLLVDFDNPFKAEYIAVQVEIKKDDFNLLTSSRHDQLIVKNYKDLFRDKK